MNCSRFAIRTAFLATLALGAAPAVRAADEAPSGLAGAYLAGRHADANADSARAVTFYNRAREIDPSNARLLEDSYFLATQLGDFAQAIPAAKKAYDAAPRRGIAPVVLAMDAYKRKDYQAAWSYIEKIPPQSLNSFALPVLRAWAQAPLRPTQTAISELALLKNFQDTARLADVMTGLLEEHYGTKDAALASYDALATNIENERISVVRLIVGGYHRLGHPEKAKAVLARYEKANGSSPMLDALAASLATSAPAKITPAEGMAEALYAAAELLLQSDPNTARVQVAVAYAQTALYLNPNLAIARRFVGSALAARGRFDDANAVLASVTKTTPGYLEARMQIADNLLRMKKTEEAIAALKEILKERPQWSEAHVVLGDVLRGEKRFMEAAGAYTEALKLRPSGTEGNWTIHYTRGIAYERAKDWKAAEADFKKALELRPGEPSVLNYLGYSYLDRGVNLREARRLIEMAYTKRPDDGYIIDSLGWVLYMSGEYEKAVTHLEKAIEAAPADATINDHLGDAYWKVGRRTEARFQWQRALTLDLDEQQRGAIRTKLEQGLAQN